MDAHFKTCGEALEKCKHAWCTVSFRRREIISRFTHEENVTWHLEKLVMEREVLHKKVWLPTH
jgi:hypothetical protein